MTHDEICLKHDSTKTRFDQRAQFIGWVVGMVSNAEDFPLPKHTPEAFLKLHNDCQQPVPDFINEDDVRRAFAVYALTLEEGNPIVIPDELVLMDEITAAVIEIYF